jgi:predicted enzyme related to lactoylglutathione lyase
MFKNSISWFEIRVNDLEASKEFYEAVLSIKMGQFTVNEQKMYTFPSEEEGISGAILKEEPFRPSSNGTIVYLNTEDIDKVLKNVSARERRIIIPKMLIDENIGYSAVFEDFDGNFIGLFQK